MVDIVITWTAAMVTVVAAYRAWYRVLGIPVPRACDDRDFWAQPWMAVCAATAVTVFVAPVTLV